MPTSVKPRLAPPLAAAQEYPDRCRSIRQLARHWRCAPSRVRQLIKRGLLHAFAIGKSVRITPEAIAEAQRLLAVPAATARRKRQVDGITAEVAALLSAEN